MMVAQLVAIYGVSRTEYKLCIVARLLDPRGGWFEYFRFQNFGGSDSGGGVGKRREIYGLAGGEQCITKAFSGALI